MIGRVRASCGAYVWKLALADGVPPTERLSEFGVARISYGAIPYIRAMKALREEALKVLP